MSGSGGVPTARDFSSSGFSGDPFTGGGAYVSGSGGVPTASDFRNSGRNVDPFTGSGSYATDDGPSATLPTSGIVILERTNRRVFFDNLQYFSFAGNSFFPIDSPITFNVLPKMDSLIGKLCEFNQKVPLGSKLSEEEINRISQLGKTGWQHCFLILI